MNEDGLFLRIKTDDSRAARQHYHAALWGTVAVHDILCYLSDATYDKTKRKFVCVETNSLYLHPSLPPGGRLSYSGFNFGSIPGFHTQTKVRSSRSSLLMSVSSYVHAPSSSARLHFCLLGHTAEAVWLPGVETFMFHFKTMLMPEMSAIHSVSSSSRDSSGGWKSSLFLWKIWTLIADWIT